MSEKAIGRTVRNLNTLKLRLYSERPEECHPMPEFDNWTLQQCIETQDVETGQIHGEWVDVPKVRRKL